MLQMMFACWDSGIGSLDSLCRGRWCKTYERHARENSSNVDVTSMPLATISSWSLYVEAPYSGIGLFLEAGKGLWKEQNAALVPITYLSRCICYLALDNLLWH